jgi:hypothetical protein
MLTEVGVGLYNSPSGTLHLSIEDISPTVTFVVAHCRFWNISDATNPIEIPQAPNVFTVTATDVAIALAPVNAAGNGILYQLQLAFAYVPITAQATLLEKPCGQQLNTLNRGKLGLQLLIQVVS